MKPKEDSRLMCRMKRGLTIFAYLLLAVMVLALFGFTAYEAWTAHWLGGALSSIILVGVGLGVFWEGKDRFLGPAKRRPITAVRAGGRGSADWRGCILYPGA